MNQPSILVIDDQPYNFDVIEALLPNQLYELHYASSGQEAIDSLDVFKPDVILLDLMMPELDGLQVCGRIKATPRWQRVPIIMVTALNTKEDLAQCLKAGADDFISKPLNSVELRARVNSMLRIKKQYEALQTSLERQVVLEAEKIELLEIRTSQLEHEVVKRTAALKATLENLLESKQHYATLAAAVPVGIFRTDPEGNCLYVNDYYCTITGLTSEEAKGTGWAKALHRDDQDRIRDEWYQAVIENRPFRLEYRFERPDSTDIWVLGEAVTERNAQGQIMGYVGTIMDINDRKKAEEVIIHNALHDPLTNLPNRTLLMERLTLALTKAQDVNTYRYAVLFLDLDRFKVINDSLGHLAGDELLKSIAQKLKTHLKERDLVARLGGDEFVILLENISGPEEVISFTERILKDCQTPLLINNYEMYISTSIGIVLGTTHYSQASDLLRDADIAMYVAKGQGRSTYKIFDTDMHTQAVNRMILETDLRKALEREEFIVYYQPIIDLYEERLIGFEALVRWQHPTRGLVSPGEFVPITEETGLIVQIDSWIFYKACQQLASWKSRFATGLQLKVSINLSVQDLRKVDLIEDIDRILTETGLDGNSISLEITESMLIENINQTIVLLTQLKARKISISIDDFGTGYSSLNYLHRLPADSLKIDQSFVSGMKEGNRNYQVVSTIIALSNQLGLNVIAEGVETAEQLQWLQQLGCQFGQGYLFSKPLSAQDIETHFLQST